MSNISTYIKSFSMTQLIINVEMVWKT